MVAWDGNEWVSHCYLLCKKKPDHLLVTVPPCQAESVLCSVKNPRIDSIMSSASSFGNRFVIRPMLKAKCTHGIYNNQLMLLRVKFAMMSSNMTLCVSRFDLTLRSNMKNEFRWTFLIGSCRSDKNQRAPNSKPVGLSFQLSNLQATQ